MSAQEEAAATDQPLEADELETADSALGEDASTYTQSIRSSLLESVKENSRGYHKFRDGRYILPEDDREQDRLDMQHGLFLHAFANKLYQAPIEKPIKNVLDLGTGTGIWAIDFADQNPESNVIGIDLSPIQPNWVPPNCKFEVDDYESEWTYQQKFDLIHGRFLCSSCADFPTLFRRSFDALEPGGWFETKDLYVPVLSDDDTMKGTAWQTWNDLFTEAMASIGRDVGAVTKYADWLKDVGFEDVYVQLFKWPINTWPKDKRLKEIGKWNMLNMLDGIEGFTFRPWTKILGKTAEETELFLMDVRKDIQDRNIHSYWPLYVIYGRKPKNAS